jgi:predicted amidohydrolase YtcJ
MTRSLGLCLLLALFPPACGYLGDDMQADLIVTGGDIWTGEPGAPHAEAMAVGGGRILVVGTSEEALALRNSRTKVVDLGGSFVMPGFIDSHTHFLDGGASLLAIQLRDARDEADFARRLADKARQLPQGQWLTGGGWNHEAWASGRLPTRALIDPVTPDNPVFVERLDGHMALANSLALRLAGVSRGTEDPPGGQILRDPAGEPTGILRDEAMRLVNRVIPEPTSEDRLRALRAAFAEARRFGVTSVVAIGERQDLDAFQTAITRGEATVRVHAVIPVDQYRFLVKMKITRDSGADFLRLGAIKGFVDGSLGSATAWLYEPYVDEPGSLGLPAAMWLHPQGNMKRMIKDADAAGLQIMLHAIGDRANEELLRTYEEVAKENGLSKDRRFRVEHAQHLIEKSIGDFARLRVIASMQPAHLVDDGCWAEKRLGPKRLRGSYAFRSLLDRKVTVAFGTDWPVAPLNPMLGVYAAVTRRTSDGKNPNGWIPEQKISVEESLTCYTRQSAYATFAEDRLGTLKPGKLADLVVLSTSPFKVAPEKLKDISVVRTYVGGECVYGEEDGPNSPGPSPD